MTKTRGVIYGVLICAGLVLLWTRKHKQDIRTDAEIKSVTLPAADTVRIVFSPSRHEIETIVGGPHRRPEIRRTFVPSSGASVDIRRDGSVQVNSRTWGTTVHPFVGVAFGSDIVGRAALGLDVFYWQRWELGGGLLVDRRLSDTRMFVTVNYNVYGNILVGLGLDHRHTAHVMASIKF